MVAVVDGDVLLAMMMLGDVADQETKANPGFGLANIDTDAPALYQKVPGDGVVVPSPLFVVNVTENWFW